MRWALLQRLLGLDRRGRQPHSEPLHDQEPHLRIDTYSRLSDMEDRLPGRPGTLMQPLKAGDAAALGQRLLAGRDEWVRVDAHGHAELVQVDKQELVQRLWVPFRDLRQLDPMVPIPYPSSIFIRERALVVNLESVRMIIAKDEVYVTSVPVPGSSEMWQHPSPDDHFTQDLAYRLASDPASVPSTSQAGANGAKVDRDMPFELRALEAALTAGVSVLEIAVGNLERAAFPALEALIHNVSRAELDKVRNVKSLTTHLINRVGRVQRELEEILDDDQDMADMYLGRREELEVAEPKRRASLEAERRRSSMSSPLSPAGRSFSPQQHEAQNANRSDQSEAAESLAADRGDAEELGKVEYVTYDPDEDVFLEAIRPHDQRGPQELRSAHPHEIEDAENLLENYFMQVEFLHSRLTQLKERVGDTENLIDLELDQRRNELVTLDLILTCVATSCGFVAMIGGIFGMNLAPMPIESVEWGFYVATFGSIGFGTIILVGFLGYAYWKKILLIPA